MYVRCGKRIFRGPAHRIFNHYVLASNLEFYQIELNSPSARFENTRLTRYVSHRRLALAAASPNRSVKSFRLDAMKSTMLFPRSTVSASFFLRIPQRNFSARLRSSRWPSQTPSDTRLPSGMNSFIRQLEVSNRKVNPRNAVQHVTQPGQPDQAHIGSIA